MKFDPNISATRILSIPDDQPGMLFSSAIDAKDEYKLLAKMWHPDTNKDPRASDVLAKINALRQKASEYAAIGEWRVFGVEEFVKSDGSRFLIRYKRKHVIDVGLMLYGERSVSFIVEAKHAVLFDSAEKIIRGFRYADKKMEEDMKKFLPNILKTLKLKDGRLFMHVEKTPDVFLLRDVVDHQGGKLDPKHAAWVTSRLMGLCCYLDWAGLSYNAMTLDNIFVSPKYHTALLLGGWWFAKPFGDTIKVLPKQVHNILPSSVLKEKIASGKTDRLLARAIGRELAGDRSGNSLKRLGVPEAMADYLRHPLGPTPYQDMGTWMKALESSFGPRRFTVLDIPESEIYERGVK